MRHADDPKRTLGDRSRRGATVDDTIRFACPACGKTIKAKPEHAGKRARCPREACGIAVRVPAALPPLPEREPRRVGLWLVGGVGLFVLVGGLGTWLLTRDTGRATAEPQRPNEQIASASPTATPPTVAPTQKVEVKPRDEAGTPKPLDKPAEEKEPVEEKKVEVPWGPVGEIRQYKGHKDAVTSVAFSPDGRRVLSASVGETALQLWDVETARQIKLFRGHKEGVKSVAFSSDGRRALSAGDDGTLRLWNVETGSEIRSLKDPPGFPVSVALARDGRLALSASTDLRVSNGTYSSKPHSNVVLWDVESGTEVRRFTEDRSKTSFNGVAFSPDGRKALLGCGEDLYLWDVESGRQLHCLKGHKASIVSVAFAPDGRRAVSGSIDGTIRLWDLDKGAELRVFEHKERIFSVALSADGRRLLFGSGGEVQYETKGGPPTYTVGDKTVYLWDVDRWSEVHRFTGHTHNVYCVAFSPDGHRALSGSGDSTVRLWGLPKPGG